MLLIWLILLFRSCPNNSFDSGEAFFVNWFILAENLDFRISLLNRFLSFAAFPMKAYSTYHLFTSLNNCICFWNLQQQNFFEVNISYPIRCLKIFIPNLTVSLGCNYARVIFLPTILFIYGSNFFLFHIKNECIYIFDNLSLTGLPNSSLEENSWEIFSSKTSLPVSGSIWLPGHNSWISSARFCWSGKMHSSWISSSSLMP